MRTIEKEFVWVESGKNEAGNILKESGRMGNKCQSWFVILFNIIVIIGQIGFSYNVTLCLRKLRLTVNSTIQGFEGFAL